MFCSNCNQDFLPNSSTQKYCSLVCANRRRAQDVRNKKRNQYEQNPLLCRVCAEPIPYEKRHINIFCSSSCAATKNNTLYPKRHSKFTERPCEYCETLFRPKFASHKGRFCCLKCSAEYRTQVITRNKILEGKVNQRRILKGFLIKEHGEVCVICGQEPIWCGKPLCLQVDHIDGDPDNNFPNNIRLLCPHCHTQTETSKQRNLKPNSRTQYRKAYYQKSKAYYRS